jgi:predicted enzyme related to lactoylglutathione lyase
MSNSQRFAKTLTKRVAVSANVGEILLADSNFATLVPIRNMERAIKFYTDTLGGSLNMRAEGEMKNEWASVNVGKTEFWLIRPEKRERKALAYSTFIVKDIKQAVDGLKGKGVKFLRAEKMGRDSRIEGSITFSPYGAVAFFKDSEGNLLMIWKNAP